MTQDEIIKLAREAGFEVDEGLFPFEAAEDKYIGTERTLERFAALVAEPWIETNKALAKKIIELKKQADISALPIIIEAAVKEAVLAEREACAKVCEENGKEPDDHKPYEGYDEGYLDGSNNCATAIRSRSNEH